MNSSKSKDHFPVHFIIHTNGTIEQKESLNSSAWKVGSEVDNG